MAMCAMAREPEDVDRGSDCCENEVDIEGPFQDQLTKLEASSLLALTNAKLLYSEQIRHRRQVQGRRPDPRIYQGCHFQSSTIKASRWETYALIKAV